MKTFLIFDFGANEDAAQKARHRLEGWKQGFRLGDKLTLKFERESGEEAKPKADGGNPEAAETEEKPSAAAKERSSEAAEKKHRAASGGKEKKKAKKAATEEAKVRVAVELNFSSHEKMSYHRWLERIPAEEPFAGVAHEVIQEKGEKFEKTVAWFQGLESGGVTTRKPH